MILVSCVKQLSLMSMQVEDIERLYYYLYVLAVRVEYLMLDKIELYISCDGQQSVRLEYYIR